MTTILIALGGNAIKQAGQEGTTEEQFRNCSITTKFLAEIIKRMNKSDRLVITHGNGPQVGNLMVQQELGKRVIPAHPMDVLGAMTQGQIGYMIQQTLENHLKALGIKIPVCTIVNQVLVDEDDPEFLDENASKPVGNFFTKEEVVEIKKVHPDYIIKKVKPSGEKCWRRTVPSPDPIVNIEGEAIKKLVDCGVIVIASGGGGIPVALDKNGHYGGVEAVIDKDLAGEKLAEVIDADIFLILTDVEHAMLNFGKLNQRPIHRMTLKEAEKYMKEGYFLPGSMGPKVKACIRFLKHGGKKAIITSLEKAIEGLEGKTGTLITLS